MTTQGKGAMPLKLFIVALVLSAAFITYRMVKSAPRDSAPAPAAAQDFDVVTVADELNFPWSVAFLPGGGGYLVTERDGRLWHIAADGERAEIAGVPAVYAAGQAGLFDVALAPDFAENGMIYLAYAGGDADRNNTELARARLDLAGRQLQDVEVIFRALPKVRGDNHYGGRILFAPDGKLFLTLGDRFDYRDEAQNLANHLGAIVRLNPDGSVPEDNPFAGREDARPEIYSYGHRNTQGIARQPGTDVIWAHEHGPRGGDEVNILEPGANYGWPVVTFGREYWGPKISDDTRAPGMADSVLQWTPSIAPSGMAFYDGDKFPAWQGDIFLGALAGQHLRLLQVEDGKIVHQEMMLKNLEERIRDVRSGPDGYIYLLTDSPSGRLLRLVPKE